MANIKSQIKRNSRTSGAHERNKAVRTALKTSTKKVRTAVADGDAEAARSEPRGRPRPRQGRRQGVLHKRTAARRKSRLAKAANSRRRRRVARLRPAVDRSPAIAATSVGHHDVAGRARLQRPVRLGDPVVERDQLGHAEPVRLLAVAARLPVEPEPGRPRELGRRHPLGLRAHLHQVAQAARDTAQHHERIVAALLDRRGASGSRPAGPCRTRWSHRSQTFCSPRPRNCRATSCGVSFSPGNADASCSSALASSPGSSPSVSTSALAAGGARSISCARARWISHGSRSLRTIFSSRTSPTGFTARSSAAGGLPRSAVWQQMIRRRLGIRRGQVRDELHRWPPWRASARR